ncbi:glucosyltransferase domain-containing protein [Dyella sp. M7H15-1]|uniref:glucosyltransferase domain-containing protein n=1 Tax=Dyella sp. M7H15-1 TaxID=2501295 RepID=UPI0013E8F44C|nr:glucosyltransferase domain-containing protein [Dyella sp. M7H15-1]
MEASPRNQVTGRQVFAILFLGYLLFVLYPLLRADRPYNDDLVRALNGAYGWNANGRPLTTLLMRALELNLPSLVDIAPLTQILAIALLALSGVLIARRYKLSSPLLAALLTLPLGAQPFFLENLSFRFDAPGMALAILLALIPITTLRQKRSGFYLGALSLLGSLCSYQPAFNVFLIFALLDLLAAQTERSEPRQIFWLTCRYVTQTLLAAAVYTWKVAPSIKDWVQEHSRTIHSIRDINVVVHNTKTMGTYLLSAMPYRWTLMFLPLMLLMAVTPLVITLHYTFTPSTQHAHPLWVKSALIILALLAPAAALVSLAGPMLLLVSPIVAARVFPSVGALISAGLIALYLASHATTRRWAVYLTNTVASIWVAGMLVFAGAYSNAQSAQKHYEDRIASQLSNDLAELKANDGIQQFLLDGSAGLSPLTAHAASRFPLLNTVVPTYLQGRDFMSRYFMKHYVTGLHEAREDDTNNAAADAVLGRACTAPVVYTRSRYTLRLVGDTAVVTLPGGLPTGCPNPP